MPCCLAMATSALPSSLRNHWKLPPAESTTPITCQAPGTAWQPRWSRPSGSKPSWSAWAKTTPEVPIVAETTPWRTIPLPTAPAGWSPPPPTTGVPLGNPRRLRSGLAHLAGDLGALVTRGQETRVDVELAQQLAAPAAIGDVEHQGPGGVAHLRGERPGQPVADVVLGQENLAHPVPVLRLVLANPEQLGGGEPREGGVGHHPHQGLAAAGPLLDLRGTRRPCADRSRAAPGGSPRPASSRKTDPCICPERPIPATSAGLNLPAASTAWRVLTVASHQSPGSCSDQPGLGMGAGILGRRRGEDRPLLVDGQGLGPRGADIDPQCDAHVVISQRSPHRKIRGSTPGGSRRASASNASTGTVLKVNIS